MNDFTKLYKTTAFSVALLLTFNPEVWAENTEQEVRSNVESICNEIVALELNREKSRSRDDLNEIEAFAWAHLVLEMHDLFVQEMEENSEHCETFINSYLDQALSRPGPEGFRLFLAAEGILFSIEPTKRIMQRGETWIKCSRASAEYQLYLLANNRDKGAALYQFVAWRRQFFRTDRMYSQITNAIENVRNEDDIYWHGRNFALLAMATGREDLVHGLGKKNMSSRCSQWARWIGLQFTVLRPSSVGSFWYVDTQGNVDDPWSEKFQLDEMLIPTTPLPNWTEVPLKLTGDEMPNHS